MHKIKQTGIIADADVDVVSHHGFRKFPTHQQDQMGCENNISDTTRYEVIDRLNEPRNKGRRVNGCTI